jgi:predicted metal-dependent hydrolase
MTNSYTINIRGIGPVFLEKSRRARRLIIYVKASKSVRVAVPTRTSYKKAEEFVLLKKEWIRRTLEIVKGFENERKLIQDKIQNIDKASAGKKLIGRLEHLAKKHGFHYNKVSTRNQRTRWGSCSLKNNISLNLKLVLLPEELIDYVLLHELVHTRVHDHSKKFWDLLDRYIGNSKALAKRLRTNELRLL